MDEKPIDDLSFDRSRSTFGNEEGYDLWFDLPAKPGDATTSELQTLCQGSMLLGRIAQRLGWDWVTLIRNIDHLSAPNDGHLAIEIDDDLFNSEAFRTALQESVQACGLRSEKIRLVDAEYANAYVLDQGLPPIAARRDRG